LIPPLPITPEYIDTLISELATWLKPRRTSMFDRSIVPLQLSLPLPKRTEREKHKLHVDKNLEAFITLRLCRSMPKGRSQRPHGYLQRLTMEVVAYCGIGKIMLPSGDMLIENLVGRLDRNQNSESLETRKAYLENYNEERKKDPVKREMNVATNNRKCIRKKLVREKGYMPVDVPHITNLTLQPHVIFNFIEKHQNSPRSKSSMLDNLHMKPLYITP